MTVDSPKKPWWVLSESYGFCVTAVVAFALGFALQLPGFLEDIQAGQVSVWRTFVLILPAVLVGWYVACAVRAFRLRRR